MIIKASVVFALLFVLGARALAQREVTDVSRAAAGLDDYILQGLKLDQQNTKRTLDARQLDALSRARGQIGPAVAPSLAGSGPAGTAPPPASGVGAASQALQKGAAANTSDPAVSSYMAWVEQRRVADAAIAAQVSALAAKNDGQPLDWATHSKLASDLGTLGNDRLELSTLEANAAAETRVRQRAATGDYLAAELEAERRARLERATSDAR